MSFQNEHEFQHHRLIARATNCPVLITREKLEQVCGILFEKAGINVQFVNPGGYSGETDRQNRDTGPMQIADGKAIIPIQGTLVSKVGGLHPHSGMQGYNQILDMLNTAMNDPDVSEVLFDVDSPGGEAAGFFDAAEIIKGWRGTKPMTSVLHSGAFSAAYGLASATDRIVLSDSGRAGSIGVIAVHFDESEAMAARGVKATVVFAGKHKADLTPFAPLSKEALERLQSDVEDCYQMFCQTVADNRGLSVEAVRGTEASIYRGKAAIDIGLADDLGNPVAVLAGNPTPSISMVGTAQPETKEAKTMPWKMLLERLNLDDKGEDSANYEQVVAQFKHLTEKAKATDTIAAFCTLHGVDSLDAMTAKLQNMVDGATHAEAVEAINRMKAEARVAELMQPAEGKIAAANKDWAIDFAMRDPEGFEKVVGQGPRLIPQAAGSVAAGSDGASDPTLPEGMGQAEFDLLCEEYGGREKVMAVLKDKEGGE